LFEQKVQSVFRANNYSLRYKLLPSEQAYPLPGDQVHLERVSVLPKVLGDLDNTPTVSESFPLVIDADGFLHVPVAANPALETPTSAIERSAFAQIGGATNRIKVCFPQLPTNQRCSLDDISTCLSASPALEEWLPEYLDVRCRMLGIDDRLRPLKGDDGERSNIRYFLTPGERSWTLIFEGGESATIRFTSSTAMRQAISSAYRVKSGRDLFHKCNEISIEVCTESGRANPDEPGLFTGVLRRTEEGPLDSALILPGDVVRLLPPR
jgi:hypothetical protein